MITHYPERHPKPAKAPLSWDSSQYIDCLAANLDVIDRIHSKKHYTKRIQEVHVGVVVGFGMVK